MRNLTPLPVRLAIALASAVCSKSGTRQSAAEAMDAAYLTSIEHFETGHSFQFGQARATN